MTTTNSANQKLDLDGLADRINDRLHPIHRGAIWIGPGLLAVFGNDGYSSASDGRAKVEAERMYAWLIYKGWSPSPLQVSSEGGYTWVIVATCKGLPREREQADRRLWKLWTEVCETKRPGRFHQAQAAIEIDNIGGGYTDTTLATPLKGKGGPVRGHLLTSRILLGQAEDGEDVHLLLAGVPYPAKILAVEQPPHPDPAVQAKRKFVLECVLLTEDVGDPRSEDNNTATAYMAAGWPIHARDFGEKHPSTGRRMLVSINPITGEALPE